MLKLTGKLKPITAVTSNKELAGIFLTDPSVLTFAGNTCNQSFTFGQECTGNNRNYAIPFAKRCCYRSNNVLVLAEPSGISSCWGMYSSKNISIDWVVTPFTISGGGSSQTINTNSFPFVGFSSYNRAKSTIFSNAYYIAAVAAYDGQIEVIDGLDHAFIITAPTLVAGNTYKLRLTLNNTYVMLYIDDVLVYKFTTRVYCYCYPLFVSSHTASSNILSSGANVLLDPCVSYNKMLPFVDDLLDKKCHSGSFGSGTMNDIYVDNSHKIDWKTAEQYGVMEEGNGNMLAVSDANAALGVNVNGFALPVLITPQVVSLTINSQQIHNSITEQDLNSYADITIVNSTGQILHKYAIRQKLESMYAGATKQLYYYVLPADYIIDSFIYNYPVISYTTSTYDGSTFFSSSSVNYTKGTRTSFLYDVSPKYGNTRNYPTGDFDQMVEDYQQSYNDMNTEYTSVLNTYLPGLRTAAQTQSTLCTNVADTIFNVYCYNYNVNNVSSQYVSYLNKNVGVFMQTYYNNYYTGSSPLNNLNTKTAAYWQHIRNIINGVEHPDLSFAKINSVDYYDAGIIKYLNMCSEYNLLCNCSGCSVSVSWVVSGSSLSLSTSGSWITGGNANNLSSTISYSMSYNNQVTDATINACYWNLSNVNSSFPFKTTSDEYSGSRYLTDCKCAAGPVVGTRFYYSSIYQSISPDMSCIEMAETYSNYSDSNTISNYNNFYNYSTNSYYRNFIDKTKIMRTRSAWNSAKSSMDTHLGTYYNLKSIALADSTSIINYISDMNYASKYNQYDRKIINVMSPLQSGSCASSTFSYMFLDNYLYTFNNGALIKTTALSDSQYSVLPTVANNMSITNMNTCMLSSSSSLNFSLDSQNYNNSYYTLLGNTITKLLSNSYTYKIINAQPMTGNHVSFIVNSVSDQIYVSYGAFVASPPNVSSRKLDTTNYGLQFYIYNKKIVCYYSSSSSFNILTDLNDNDKLDIVMWLNGTYLCYTIYVNGIQRYTYTSGNSYMRISSRFFMSGLLIYNIGGSVSSYTNYSILPIDTYSTISMRSYNNAEFNKLPHQGTMSLISVLAGSSGPYQSGLISSSTEGLNYNTIKENKWTTTVTGWSNYVQFNPYMISNKASSTYYPFFYMPNIKTLELQAYIDSTNARPNIGVTTFTPYVDQNSFARAIFPSTDSGWPIVELRDVSGCSYTPYMKARYIRDYLSGSNQNTGSYWKEIQAYNSSGQNVALGKPVTTNGIISGNAGELDITTVVDGNTNTYVGIGTVPGASSDIRYLEVDLGAVYDLTHLMIYHYFNDGRTFTYTRTDISEDGENWFTLYDSTYDGTYAETSSGRKQWPSWKVGDYVGMRLERDGDSFRVKYFVDRLGQRLYYYSRLSNIWSTFLYPTFSVYGSATYILNPSYKIEYNN